MQNTGSPHSSEKSEVPERIESVATSPVAARRRVRFFQRADSWFNRFVRLATAMHEGFWLGCLSADELNTVTAGHYAQSRETTSAEGNLRDFFDWEGSAVERYFPVGSNVLVAGAGGGREILALRRTGYSAEGFECNPAVVEASNTIFDQLAEPRGVFFCPADHVPAGLFAYSGIIVGWTAYSHIPSRERRVAFLRALRQRALPASPVLLSFFARSGNSRYDAVAFRIANWTRRFVPGRKEAPEIGDHLNWSYSHWFTREEIESELREAGIRLVDFGEVGEGYAVGVVE
jgi:Methyltransferase domain